MCMILCYMSEYCVFRFHLSQLYHSHHRENCPYAYQYSRAFMLLIQLVLLESEQRGTSILAPTCENFVFFYDSYKMKVYLTKVRTH